jgi:hypothetical protein
VVFVQIVQAAASFCGTRQPKDRRSGLTSCLFANGHAEEAARRDAPDALCCGALDVDGVARRDIPIVFGIAEAGARPLRG